MPRVRRYVKRRTYTRKPRSLKGYGAYSYAKRKPAKRRKTTYAPKRRAVFTRGRKPVHGYGSYRTGGSHFGKGSGTSPPSVRNTKCGFIVSHREYIQDLSSSIAFTGIADYINPGNAALFPWLSQVAAQFEQWKPRGINFFNFNLKIGIVFEFKSTSTDLAGAVNGNPALGTVIMATEYNVYNGTFDSKQQMENYEFANSCKPSVNMYHQVECAKKETATMGGVLYVSPVNGVPTQSPQSAITGQAGDLRLYYLGLFQAATVGMQSNGSNIGELWVSYEIEFLKPKIVVGAPNNGAAGGSMDHFAWSALTTNNIGQVATTGILQTAPFGSGTVVQKPTYYSNLGGIVTATAIANAVPALNGQGVATGALATSNANAYYFNPGISRGLYMIQYNAVYGTPAGAAGNFQAVLTNCAMFDLTQDNTLPANQVQTQTNLAGTTTLSSNVTMFIQVTAANASFTLTGTAGSTVPTYADLYVMQMPFEMN
uniref:Capsid protein n=1 Tax=Cruciviridae sp. TaxID=1955495 RepID=A0A1S6LVL9_9VIRU|nr:capsid protein [Cruciviridae sp.]AQU11768.1 capsid protein [Cruciviridae sp.]